MNLSNQSPNRNGRPQSSINKTDIHIYVVPLDLWDEQQNLILNDIINEAQSAGFIRVEPEQSLSDLRIEIEEQLGYEIIPKDYVFCKSVGRCLAQVRERQEDLLKAKHFLPPNSYSPELFIVDGIVAKRNQQTSNSNKTNNSSYGAEMRNGRRSIDENLRREMVDRERERERQKLKEENDERIRQREAKLREVDDSLNMETARKMKEKEKEFNRKKDAVKPSDNPDMEARRHEIEDLQNEIMKRYQELTALENEHQKKIAEWEIEEERRKQEEEDRRRLFEEMEMERRRQEQAMIAKQKDELSRLEKMLDEKHIEIHNTEEQLGAERNKREEMRQVKEKEIEDLKVKVQESLQVDPDLDEKIHKLQTELEEMDKKQKDLEQVTRLEREQAEIEFEMARLEFEKMRNQWEQEKKARDIENSERLQEEQRLREMYEQKRLEHEERMEKERKRMIEEREKFNEEQRHWDEEKLRYENEEYKRQKEMEQAILEAQDNKLSIPMFELKDPDLILEGATDHEQKNHMKQILKVLKSERELEEKVRDDSIRRVRAMQMKTQFRRDSLRDFWKKKYLDEKKKTPPLEDQLSRYKEGLEILHKKLVSTMELGMKDQKMTPKHPGFLNPSNKANLLLEAFRIQRDIEDIQQKITFNQMRLSSEKKLREQTETELKMIKIEAMQKKIRLSRTRSDQLAILPSSSTTDFLYTPHMHSTAHDSYSQQVNI